MCHLKILFIFLGLQAVFSSLGSLGKELFFFRIPGKLCLFSQNI